VPNTNTAGRVAPGIRRAQREEHRAVDAATCAKVVPPSVERKSPDGPR
jgi:hypothetical protein